jgi:hypothetical protein|tara:strand:- start:717 stop:893 length:177 start_codon:yes stop_codon:yes gene_type:complete
MNDILDSELYPIEEKLEIAKILLAMKDQQLQKLTAQLHAVQSNHAWIQDQSSNHRMGA